MPWYLQKVRSPGLIPIITFQGLNNNFSFDRFERITIRRKLYDMISIDAARAINVADFKLKAGAAAHLVVLDSPNELEALRCHAPPAHIISHGIMVDQVRMRSMAQDPMLLA